MSTLDANVSIARALDERLAIANQAFADCDMETYATVFSPQLKYTQPDGTTPSTGGIFADIADQFSRLVDCSFENRRTNLTVESPDKVIDTLEINVWVELRYFFILKRRINVSRKSTFTWLLTHAGWQVFEVVAHSESIDVGRWHLSFTNAG